MELTVINPEEIQSYLEVRSIYDGWSVAVMKDGTYRNRWEPGDRRYEATEEVIKALTQIEQGDYDDLT